jgi:glucokinase
VVPGLGTQTTLRIARHGPRAGVFGAALLAAQEHAEDTGRDLQGAISGEATAS